MNSKWKKVKLKDIGKIITGKTPKTSIEDNYGGNIPFLTPSDNMDDKYIYHTNKTLSSKGLNEVKNCLIPKNSICVSCIGSDLGKVVLTTEDTVTNQQINSIIVNKNFDVEFIYYLMLIVGKKLNYLSKSSTAVPIINKSFFSSEIVTIPFKDIQIKISYILSTIDKKIEINKKINHNLYHILMDLFIKNYLNFNENEFSNSIETIPKLWNIGHFNDIIKEVIAGDWGKSEIEGNYTKKTFCIRGADIPDLKENFVSTIPIRYILQKNFNKKHLIENSVVIEISGGSPSQSTGRTLFITNNLLNQYNHDLICTNFCKSILAEEEYSYFVYFYLNYLYDRNVMFAYENGTTGIKNFDFKSFFNNFPIIIPVKEELVTFNKICELFFDKIYKNIDEMNKLSHIKNILLPKLMSGEIDVSNIKI